MESGPPERLVIAPMGVGEVVDAGITLGRRNFSTLARVAAWGTAVGYALQGLLQVLAGGSSRSANVFIQALSGTSQSASDLSELSAAGAAAAVMGAFITTVATSIASMAVIVVCARLIQLAPSAPQPTASEAYREVLRCIPALIGLGFIAAFVSIPLIIAFPVGIYLGLRWANAFNAIVIERTGPIRALGRSWELTRRSWWHTAVILLIASMAIGAVQYVLSAVLGLTSLLTTLALQLPAVSTIVSALLGACAHIVITPFSAGIYTVLYYELRARAEGFDLEQRMLRTMSSV